MYPDGLSGHDKKSTAYYMVQCLLCFVWYFFARVATIKQLYLLCELFTTHKEVVRRKFSSGECKYIYMAVMNVD